MCAYIHVQCARSLEENNECVLLYSLIPLRWGLLWTMELGKWMISSRAHLRVSVPPASVPGLQAHITTTTGFSGCQAFSQVFSFAELHPRLRDFYSDMYVTEVNLKV